MAFFQKAKKAVAKRIRLSQVSIGKAIKRLSARYDSAQTNHENQRHWANADNLSADAATRPDIRRSIRSRARYEYANNTYTQGMVHAYVNYVVGRGARLQMQTEDEKVNREVESKFMAWSKIIGLGQKIHLMERSKIVSGEVFSVLSDNPRLHHPVQLDMNLIEADRVTKPFLKYTFDPLHVDGIQYDKYGNPLSYHILHNHPGSNFAGFGNIRGTEYPADSVFHMFRADRPGQSRGVSEISAALPLFALARRYTLAVVTSAEAAAIPSGVIYTDSPAESDAEDTPESMDIVNIDRSTYLTMPFGWSMKQIKAEQPTSTYTEFMQALIHEIARVLNMPYNIAAGDSSKYNYASGRLDHQSFFKTVEIAQEYIERTVLNRLFMEWFREASLVDGYLPDAARRPGADTTHQWFWDGIEHVDPSKEASAQEKRLKNNTTTLANEYARRGLDWELAVRQRAKEVKLIDELMPSLSRDENKERDSDASSNTKR